MSNIKTQKKSAGEATGYVIDATDKSIGRLATHIASVLRGKTTTSFMRHKAPETGVKVIHASRIRTTEKKRGEKLYRRHTHYPGGLRTETLGTVIAKKGHAEALRKAVYGMLPAHKLRKGMRANLIIEN